MKEPEQRIHGCMVDCFDSFENRGHIWKLVLWIFENLQVRINNSLSTRVEQTQGHSVCDSIYPLQHAYTHWNTHRVWVLQIAEKVKPPRLMVAILIKLANIVPTWKIVPTKDIIANAIKDPVKRKEVRSDVLFPGLKFGDTLILTLL